MRLVLPAAGCVGLPPADQIELVPPARIREMVIEDRLVRRRGRQPYGQDERAVGKTGEHDREGTVVAPPRVTADRAQSARLHEVAGAIAVRGAVARERAAQPEGLPFVRDGMRAGPARQPREVVPAADARHAVALAARVGEQVTLGRRPYSLW